MKAAFLRHIRFYAALACGLAAWGLAARAGLKAPALAAGDVFYLVFLGICLVQITREKAADLKRRARREDEGIAVVMLITIATMAYFCAAAFIALNRRQGGSDVPSLVLAGIGAPLGWLVLHTVMAFHYADIHYFEDPETRGDGRDLRFPGGGDPGPWDFLYYSFVVGMTAQVSDVAVTTTAMRRATLLHGVISFFFNTVFIALAVNASVSLAS